MKRPVRPGELVMSGFERSKFGVTVTFENANGGRLTLWRVGGTDEAIRSACDDAARVDETFRVLSVSTPATIYADIVGRTAHRLSGIQRPELSMLRKAGRGSMLHPLLVGESRNSERINHLKNRAEGAA